MRNNRNTRRSLSSKVAERVANRQNGSKGFSYLMLPDNVEVFKPKKEGNVRFNIIPYVAGKNNRDADPGELDFEFTFWTHTIGEGDDRRTIVCPKKTYGKPCPICEEVERLSKNYVENQEEIKAIKAKQRQLFNIVDARDEENKIQIYDTSYFKGFGELLDKRLRNFDDEDDEDFRDFADIPGGRTLKVMFAEDTFGGRKFFAPSSIDFVARKEELDESIIDKAVCLDSCLKVLDYDQILKLIAGTQDEPEDEEEEKEDRKRKPVAKRETVRKPSKPVRDEEEDEEEEEEPEEDQPKKSSKKPSKPAPRDDEDEDDGDEDEEEEKPAKSKKPARKPEPEDEEDEEDEEEEDEPPRKPSRKKPARDEDEDDDDEDDEDEEDEKPAKKASKKEDKKAGKKSKCPHGYVWGTDCYMYPECDKCDLVDECDAAQDQN